MATFMAMGSSSFTCKLFCALLPVSTFVALGLEHCIANMFFGPMGIALGAPVTLGEFIVKNIIPVTIGNTIGGAVCVGLAFCCVYGKLGNEKVDFEAKWMELTAAVLDCCEWKGRQNRDSKAYALIGSRSHNSTA